MTTPGHPPYLVFISHSSADAWVARQIEQHVKACGADTFLDRTHVHHGDDFEERISEVAERASELLMLLTPWSILRPYIWVEFGLFVTTRTKRIVGLLHGLDRKDVAADERIPVGLKRRNLVDLNDIDSYLSQLRERVRRAEADNVP